MLQDRGGGTMPSIPKKIFSGVRFVLFGFDSVSEAQYRSELVDGGGVDVGRYDSSCTHVIVSGRVFDEPVCVAARHDGKVLVTELWIDDSLDFGMLADTTKVLYRPVRDLSGIPGSESLHVCLTGYQRQERDDIMRMVSLMGGRFSKPLIANQVSHLICYKFEGEKYELAKKVNIKLVNHRWLEDCLKAWEILPIYNYKKSGWELEILEAEAMDSEEETEDAGRKVTDQRSIAQPCSVQGEMSVTIGSDALVKSTRNLDLQKTILAAKPFDLSDNNQLIATPHKDISSGKVSDICDSKAHQVLGHLQGIPAEKLPDNHGMDIINRKQPNTSDLTGLSLKCNGLPSNVRSSSMCMTSCEEDMKLSPRSYSRKTTEKIVSPNEQLNNLCTPHRGKSEVNLKFGANISSAESNDDAAKKCISDNLHNSMTVLNKPHLEGQTHALPLKRKLSVKKSGSKSTKSDHVSRTSGLLNVQTSINSAELVSLKLQQREPENILNHKEESNDAFPQMERLIVSSSCLRSPELAQKDSGTCIKQSPSTSTRNGQIESVDTPHCEIDHGLTHADGFEGNSLVQTRANQHGPFSKSSSLSYKRKFLKHRNSASVANISANSSSISDNKDEVLSVPSKTALDGTVRASYEHVSGVGAMCGITSSEAMPLSDCLLNNETGLANNRSTRNDPNILRSPLSGDGKNVDDAPICVGVLEASSKSTRKSETDVKSQDFGAVSMKCKPNIHNEAPVEQDGSSGEDQEVFPSALRDTKAKNSASTEIPGSCKKSKENEGSIHGNRKVLASRSIGCRPKTLRKNGCKNNSSSETFRNINLNEAAIKLGNEESSKETIGKENSPMKGKGELVQYLPHESNSNVITQDKNCLDPEKEKVMKDSCNLSVREDEDCGHKVKKKQKPVLGAKCSGGNNINSLSKINCPSAVIPDPVWFILSGNHAQRKEFQMIIKRLRGRICRNSHNWTYQATHFIVPDYVRRTEKFFAAAAAGRWILKPEYLTASAEAGKFLEEEPFEWHRIGLTEDGAISLEAPRKWRTLRESTGHGVFYGMHIIIYGECIAPPLDTLKRVVKAGDGTILATAPPYTRFLKSETGVDFAIVSASMPHSDTWVQEFLRHEIPCVLADYLVEYVCKPGSSLDRHVLYNTHKWAHNSLANLQIRSQQAVVSDSIHCAVCASPDRGEVMLICGDEAGGRGCGVGTHIDCCDPPLATVPEDDWFCPSCIRNSRKKTTSPKTNSQVKRRKK